MLFTEKYRPRNSSQIFGQTQAVAELKDFIVNYKQQKSRGALLFGPIGNGKTASVYALAEELNYEIIELNSSDLRNEKAMSSFLGAALGQQSLFFRPKIILIDEVDNISGMKDRGCIPALITAIEKSAFPVILTANDPYDKSLKALKKVTKGIEFQKLDHKIVSHGLQWVCEQEKITFEPKAISSLARQTDGDLRGALIDLQTCTTNKTFTFTQTQQLSDRKRTETILNALLVIFKSSSIDNALEILDNVDMDFKEIFLWLDENLPKEYSGKALAKAYEYLSRADIFQQRITRQQHWRFLVYIASLLTAGISSAKETKNTEFVKYQPTMRLLKIWQANMSLAKKKEICEKIALKSHLSEHQVWKEFLYLLSTLKDVKVQQELELTDEEISWVAKN